MKILETGGVGFIGSHTTEALRQAGHCVSIVDNLTTGNINNVNMGNGISFHNVDIRSSDMTDVFEKERPDMIVHFAAQRSVPKSVENPSLDADVNILGLINILNLAVKYKVDRIIFTSSGGAIYGDTDILPTPEDHLPKMISPYAISKYVGEKYVEYYSSQYGLNYTTLRLANVYGPKQTAIGESGVIPIYVENILNGRESYLYTYPDMPNGVTRDYVYVEDVAKSVIKALNEEGNDIYNIGTGKETFTKDVYLTLKEVSKTDIPLQTLSQRNGDVKRSVLEVSKAKEFLGWEAQVKFEEGIRETFNYQLKHK